MISIKKRQARAQIFKGPFYFRLVCTAFLWYLWFINAEVVGQIESLQAFDPFQILQISNDATLRDIKKQYRKMSLEKHPDRNRDNPLAVQEFIRLTKAYNVSTLIQHFASSGHLPNLVFHQRLTCEILSCRS
jgi:preprotein translocase subunit Sec63